MTIPGVYTYHSSTGFVTLLIFKQGTKFFHALRITDLGVKVDRIPLYESRHMQENSLALSQAVKSMRNAARRLGSSPLVLPILRHLKRNLS